MTNDLMTRALSAIPGYDDLDRAKRTAAEARAEARSATPAGGNLVAELADALTAGRDLPTNLADTAYASRTANAQRRADLLTVLKAVEVEIHERRDHAVAAGIDAALAVVAAELDDVVSRARPALAELGHIDTPQAAIDHGAAEAWRTAAQAADALVTLREVQGRLTALAVSGSRPERDGGRSTPRWGARRLDPRAAVLTVGHWAEDDRPLDALDVPDRGVGMLAALLADDAPVLGIPGPDEIRKRAEALDRPAEPDADDAVVVRPDHPFAPRPAAAPEVLR